MACVDDSEVCADSKSIPDTVSKLEREVKDGNESIGGGVEDLARRRGISGRANSGNFFSWFIKLSSSATPSDEQLEPTSFETRIGLGSVPVLVSGESTRTSSDEFDRISLEVDVESIGEESSWRRKSSIFATSRGNKHCTGQTTRQCLNQRNEQEH